MVFIKWEMVQLDMQRVEHIIVPWRFENVMDPYPIMYNRGRVILLRTVPCHLCIDTFEDSIEVFQVIGRMSVFHIVIKEWVARQNNGFRPFNLVKISPKMHNRTPTIMLHTPIIIWSTRGITRLGFIYKLFSVIRDHQPKLIILLEIRATENQFHSIWHWGGGETCNGSMHPDIDIAGGVLLCGIQLNLTSPPFL